MSKHKLNPKILIKLKKKFSDKSENAIYVKLSKLSRKHRVTLNAAAEIWAKAEGFSVWGLLNDKDQECLGDKEIKVIPIKKTSGKSKKIKSHLFTPSYESEFISEANKNSEAYPHIYVIENLLRKIIISEFGDSKKWWKKPFIQKDVIEYAKKIEIAESKHPWIKKRGKHPLYYIGLEELKKIITKHWDSNFRWLGQREKFRLWIDELVPIRNVLAHNVKLDKEEIMTTQTKSKWLITLINTQYKKK